MNAKLLSWFIRVNLWHVVWIATLSSEVLTAIFSFLLIGSVSSIGLIIGGAVPVLLGIPLTYVVKNVQDELRLHRDNLEELVGKRTAELAELNIRLGREIIIRRRMEHETLKAQKLESIGLLAGGIAHDFNNYLTAILNNIFLAKTSIDPGRSFERLQAAENAVRMAKSLTKQLLTFSKGGEPVKKTVNVRDIVKDSADFALRGSKAKCSFEAEGDLMAVEADEGQIGQVISNLVINADQSMPAGGTISIKAANTLIEDDTEGLKAGDYVRISIRDEGEGISEENIQRMFDPYFTTKKIGSGLGLTTSYSIVKKHGGHITVESKEGAGTTFRVYLPASGKTPDENTSEVALPSACDGYVLLLEDDALIAESTTMILEERGYKVKTASEGRTAIELYRKAKESGKPFDAVIIDLTIPGGMGGVETFGRLMGIDPDVRAVVASGFSSDPVMSKYWEFGFKGAIHKPYQPYDLISILKKIIP